MVGKSTIEHEKILADHFDTSLSDVNVIDSDKHIFEIETIQQTTKCILFTKEEVSIIKENIIEHCQNVMLDKKIPTDIGLNVYVRDIIDENKTYNFLEKSLNNEKIYKIIDNLVAQYYRLNCTHLDADYFLGSEKGKHHDI